MIVMKFGGTSIGSAAQIKSTCEIVSARLDRQPVVVVSAVGDTTDLLLAAFEASDRTAPAILQQITATHAEIIDDLWPTPESLVIHEYLAGRLSALEQCLSAAGRTKQSRELVVSFGETLSSYIVAAYLNQQGVTAQQVVASDIIATNSTFGAAEVLEAPTRRMVNAALNPLVSAGTVPVVTGFIGADDQGRTTTLGRGGSDYSAAIVGYFLGAEEIQIWTDVDGMFTTDPRLTSNAQLLDRLSFREAAELAAFGAKILHPKTIRPAVNAGIPVRIQNTFRPESAGTLITQEEAGGRAVTAIACKQRVTLVNLYATEMLLQEGFLAHVFGIFARHHISIDLVSVSETSISVTLDNQGELGAAVAELGRFTTVSLQQDVGIVTLVGTEITRSPATLRDIFRVLEQQAIVVTMASLGASDVNISLVIPADAVARAVTALHDELITAEQGVLA